MSVSVGQAVLLGAVQGLTEFLPVSSTAHLALAQRFLPGFSQPGILFDVLLHVGTLAAVVVQFRERIAQTFAGLASSDATARRAAWRLAGLLVLAVALTGAVTMPLKGVAVSGMTEFRRIGCRAVRDVNPALRRAARRARARRRRAARSRRCRRGTRPPSAPARPCRRSSTASRARGTRSPSASSRACRAGRGGVLVSALDPDDPRRRGGREPARVPPPTRARSSTDSSVPAYAVGMAVAAVVGYFADRDFFCESSISMRLTPFIVYCAVLGVVLLVFGGRLGSPPVRRAS